MFLGLLLLLPARGFGASVLDLVQDTPAIRKKYRMEIVGFSTEASPSARMEESIDSADFLWMARNKFLDLGETEKADAQLDALVSWRLSSGRENLVPYALLLEREALREADTGNHARVATLLGFAVRLAPDYPQVHLAQGYLAVKKSPLGLAELIQGVGGACAAIFRETGQLAVFIGRSSMSAVLAVLILTATWVAGLTVRYGVHLRHDLDEALGSGRRLHFGVRRLMVLVTVTSVLVILASPLWLLALGLILTWAYQGGRERAISLLLAALLAALPVLIWMASSSLVFIRSDLDQALLAVRNGSETQTQVNILEKRLAKSPVDAAVTFSLAQHHWRAGNIPRAQELFRRLRDSGGPLKVEATINLGIIVMAPGDPAALKAATELYREAVRTRSDSAAAHYNLGQALSLQFQFQEGEQELKQAMALDKGLISRQPAATPGIKPSQATVVESLPLPLLMARMVKWSDLATLRIEGVDLWNLFLTGLPSRTFPLAVAVLAVLGMLYAASLRKRGLSRRCQKCGRPFCPQCLPGGSKTAICPQCQHIFLVKEGVESVMRVEKMMEIKTYHNRRKLLGVALSAVAPGGGHVYFGRAGAGICLALLSSLLLVSLVGWEGPFVGRFGLAFPWNVLFVKIGMACFAALYLINLITAWRIGEREG